jgi:hypothetical protein
MSRNRRNTEIQDQEDQEQNITVQNEPPATLWSNFDSFWSMCIKNGTPFIKSACIEHLKAIGVWDKPDEWIKGVQNFGIDLEK